MDWSCNFTLLNFLQLRMRFKGLVECFRWHFLNIGTMRHIYQLNTLLTKKCSFWTFKLKWTHYCYVQSYVASWSKVWWQCDMTPLIATEIQGTNKVDGSVVKSLINIWLKRDTWKKKNHFLKNHQSLSIWWSMMLKKTIDRY